MMAENRILLGALIFVGLILLSNFVMYAIARGWTKNDDSRWMSALRDSLRKPTESRTSKSMDELRKRVEELTRDKKQE